MKTKIFLSGASGRMGIQIQSLLEQHQDFCLSEILDRDSLLRPVVKQADVWIDFSHDDFLFSLLEKMQKEKKFPALLSGTTNLSEKTNLELRKYATMAPVLWTPNTSLGVSVVESLFPLLASLKDYHWSLQETHHLEKKDAPSGTAKRWLQKIKNILPQNNVSISSIRESDIVGTHRLIISGKHEVVTIQHEAKDRKLFAEGALNLVGRLPHFPNGFYQMEDFLKEAKV